MRDGAKTKSGYFSFPYPVSSSADKVCEYQGGQVDHAYYNFLTCICESEGPNQRRNLRIMRRALAAPRRLCFSSTRNYLRGG